MSLAGRVKAVNWRQGYRWEIGEGQECSGLPSTDPHASSAMCPQVGRNALYQMIMKSSLLSAFS